MSERGLPVALACEACGSHALGGYCRECGTKMDELLRIANDYKEAYEVAKEETAKKCRQIARLQGEDHKKLKAHKLYPVGLRLLDKWKELCHPHAREAHSQTRVTAVVARLKGGYTEEQLLECLFGYSRFPYMVNRRRVATGPPQARAVEADLIFRDAWHVDQGLALAAEAHRRDEAMAQMAEFIPPADAHRPQSNELSELGRAAVRLTELNFYVFPVAPRGKVPVTPNGLKDATLDGERVARFWREHPDHNIGLRTGLESGVVVLDQDGIEGIASLRELEEKYGTLPSTGSVVTPRGGQHFYFTHPGVGEIRNTSGYPGVGLDIRGDGGYVLAVPSVGPNGRHYEVDEFAGMAPMPGWLLTLLAEHRKATSSIGRDPIELVVKGVKSGARNTQLTSMVGLLVARSELTAEQVLALAEVANDRCAPPLPRRDLVTIVSSIFRRENRKMLQAQTGMVTA